MKEFEKKIKRKIQREIKGFENLDFPGEDVGLAVNWLAVLGSAESVGGPARTNEWVWRYGNCVN